MKTDLLASFENIPYFTIQGFRQATGMESPNQTRTLLHRWSKAGHIIPLKKGVYLTRRFYERHGGDIAFTAAISAILVPQSYLSLEYILQQNGILTEITHPVTCVTIKNTRRINNRLGTFWYRNIRSDLYKGFSISEYFGIRYARASAAKALFDFLYLRPIPKSYRTPRFDLAGEMRLNLDEFAEKDRDEFAGYVEESRSGKMNEVLDNFRSNIWRH
ncbi:hypothetical protein FBQ99_18645 [Chloroflexi bacterium CFX2]|nr:hypothetical protein [Chloroflexi bacterium CFX2]